jgi:NhaA family Na+:H+ antiporter
MRNLNPLSHRRVRRIARPVRDFIRTEAFSGVFLLACAGVALLWANSLWDSSYHDLFTTHLNLDTGLFTINEDLRGWIDDGPMVLFFVVIGLEIKREYSGGELSGRSALLPGIAALGGMVVPALIYTAINLGGDGSRGWAIPMATDTAFALGILALAPRMAPSVRVFLLALAVVDDIGSIFVIALFYSSDVDFAWLAAAVILVGAMFVLRRSLMRSDTLFFLGGFFVWLAALQSGVSTAIFGVALGLITVHARLPRNVESPLARRERLLHPIASFVIVPLFALANAGVSLSVSGNSLTNAVILGVVVARVAGKPLGIVLFTFAALQLRVAELPRGMRLRDILAVGALAGIGFTVSLLVTELAFGEGVLTDDAKLGIIGSAIISGAFGYLVLLVSTRRRTATGR